MKPSKHVATSPFLVGENYNKTSRSGVYRFHMYDVDGRLMGSASGLTHAAFYPHVHKVVDTQSGKELIHA